MSIPTKKLLLEAFDIALVKYKDRAHRFSFYHRHKEQQLNDLKFKLITSKNEDELFSIIFRYLAEKKIKSHHSFKSYLVDELKIKIPQIDWDHLREKVITLYSGNVFRGSGKPPEKVFTEGFKERESSPLIDDYLKFRNKKIGISTTKNFECAKYYAKKHKKVDMPSYIYEINYRGGNGYDLVATAKLRGLNFNPCLHRDRFSGLFKQEVNVKNSIGSEDIVGVWEQRGNGLEWQENPYYQSERETLMNLNHLKRT